MKVLLLVMAFFSLLLQNPTISKAENNFKKYEGWGFSTKAEFMALPEYCIARFSFYNRDKSLYNKWEKIIGRDIIHFHHY